ncbi:glycosyltransferase family 28 [Agromyces protaetiae]|uniref:Glycosyltransferase family 28 n=1 Tax=Agromyces protaetiae TaxID=2509455 RepID=A0A4V0YHH0_9MICO|nr:glycosyltransferase [Agromyces protaetiae]QAY74681.1 glycosyltransferase family 28 [Agromyces protaetiae]
MPARGTATDDILLVCSGGGHLRQLAGFVDRMSIPIERQFWVTFDNQLSRSILSGRRVLHMPFIGPRDLRHFSEALWHSPGVFRERRFAEAISTGSSPAVAFLPQAAVRGIPSYYIESAARADGPSLTGKLLARIRPIRTFTQYPSWADGRWRFRGSIFDEFEPFGRPQAARTPRTAVVTVGTQEGYPFERMLLAVKPLVADFDEVLWQTGDADVSRLGIDGVASLPHDDLAHAIEHADVVISHAGVGSALTALRAGKHPILVPREAAHGEHVDDHQVQIARELERRGLATLRAVDRLAYIDLETAAGRSVGTTTPPPFELHDPAGVH